MPAFLIYGLYAYAGAHGLHDVYRIGRWTYRKFKGSSPETTQQARPTVQPTPQPVEA